MEDGEEIVPGAGRMLHVRRRRYSQFGGKRREAFLEQLAATCNVKASAEAAEVSVSAVYATRMRDAGFREAWAAAVEQGYARLEAALLEQAARKRPRVRGDKIAGGGDGPDEIEWDKAIELLRHHRHGLAGQQRPNGAVPQRVPIEAVTERLIRKLKALGVRPEDSE